MKRVLTALVLIPVVLALVFLGPIWSVALVALVFAGIGVSEYINMIGRYGVQPFRTWVWGLFGIICLLVLISTSGQADEYRSYFFRGMQAVFFLSPYMFLCAGLRRPVREGVSAAALSYLVFPWIVLPLLLIINYRSMQNGWYYVLYLLVVVWAGDIFAYYVGRSIGRHKLAPAVSPGKSWEGAAASVLSSAAIAGVLTQYGPALGETLTYHGLLAEYPGGFPTVLQAIVGAIIINIAAQFGDLTESLLKRGAGVKDSGTVLPGHGGVLDRIDALLFASPVAWVVFSVWAILQHPRVNP